MWWARLLSAAGLLCAVAGVNLLNWKDSSLRMVFQQREGAGALIL